MHINDRRLVVLQRCRPTDRPSLYQGYAVYDELVALARHRPGYLLRRIGRQPAAAWHLLCVCLWVAVLDVCGRWWWRP